MKEVKLTIPDRWSDITIDTYINDGISDCCSAPSNSDIGRCKKCGELCNILNDDEL